MRRAFCDGGQSSVTASWSLLNSQMEHCMHIRVLHFSPDVGTDDIDLLLRVSKLASEECIGEGFETLADLQVIPGADFFLFTVDVVSRRSYTGPGEAYQMFISRPGPHGPNESFSFDIFEADFLHPAFKKRAGTWLHVGSSGGVDEYVVEFKRGGLWLQRAVRGCPCEIEIYTFD